MANMSPSQIGAEVARTMDRMVTALEQGRKKALGSVAKDARGVMLKAATQVPGGDRTFSNMRRYSHGGRLNVTTSTRNDLVFVGSKGPWKIAEVGAAPHRMGRGMHPGTARSQGRSSWTRAADPIVADAVTEVPETIGDAVEGAFRG